MQLKLSLFYRNANFSR